MSLLNSTSMDDLTPEAKARKAIRHVLNLIQDHPSVGYYLGLGTESFALLTEADATFHGADIELTRKRFLPINPRNPAEGTAQEETQAPTVSLADTRFFTAMERELVANQSKGNWHDWQPDRMTCLSELAHHHAKLVRAIRYNDPSTITEHSADLANIAAKTAAQHGDLEEIGK
jgi:hypothetical protein